MQFEYPWQISANQTDSIRITICGSNFEENLQSKLDFKTLNKGCLELEKILATQVYEQEQLVLTMLTVATSVFTFTILIQQVENMATMPVLSTSLFSLAANLF